MKLPDKLSAILNDLNDESGQGLFEYALILAGLAIAVLLALYVLGPKIAELFKAAGGS